MVRVMVSVMARVMARVIGRYGHRLNETRLITPHPRRRPISSIIDPR